jgi:voltage-gated potassium channel
MENPDRETLLEQLQDWLEKPMLVLSFVWLALLVVELVWGLNRVLTILGQVIWALFVAEFGLALMLAPQKGRYLRRNWLKALALAAPALRILRLARFARLARASRGVRLLRVVSSVNRGMNALAGAMRRRGFGYVMALTLIVTLAGAAGMYALEGDAPDGGFDSYVTALWWTAMMITTMGSEYWPRTPDGRVLCLLLAVYAFAVFGYVTATLATFFIGRDAHSNEADSLGALKNEIAALRAEIAAMRGR